MSTTARARSIMIIIAMIMVQAARPGITQAHSHPGRMIIMARTSSTRKPAQPVTVPGTREGKINFDGMIDKERLAAMQAEIADAIKVMAKPEAWEAFLNRTARFHKYSFGNTMLVMMQMPEATLWAGETDWRVKHGRTLIQGAKHCWVYAPMSVKIDKADPDSARRTLFKIVKVYDVSQTEGRPLPESPAVIENLDGDAPEGFWDYLVTRATGLGFTVKASKGTREDGSTNFATKIINVRSTDSKAHQALTLAHELGHVVFDHGAASTAYHTRDGRSLAEIQAESVAYVVCRAWGMAPGPNSFGYIAHWARGRHKIMRALADDVVAASRSILDGDREPVVIKSKSAKTEANSLAAAASRAA